MAYKRLVFYGRNDNVKDKVLVAFITTPIFVHPVVWRSGVRRSTPVVRDPVVNKARTELPTPY